MSAFDRFSHVFLIPHPKEQVLELPVPEPDGRSWLWSVTQSMIKSAHRKHALVTHPDKNADREALAQSAFERVNQAFKVLSDDGKRADYFRQFLDEQQLVQQQEQGTGWQPQKANQSVVDDLELELKRDQQRQAAKQHDSEQLQQSSVNKLKDRLQQAKHRKQERAAEQQRQQKLFERLLSDPAENDKDDDDDDDDAAPRPIKRQKMIPGMRFSR